MSGLLQGLVYLTRGLGAPNKVSESTVKLVCARIADAMNPKGLGLFAMSNNILSEDTGLSEAQVRRACARLRSLNILSYAVGGTGGHAGGRGIAPIYRLNIQRLCELIPPDRLETSGLSYLTKGAQSEPLSGPKGDQRGPKRGATEPRKGRSTEPPNEYEIQQRARAHAPAREGVLFEEVRAAFAAEFGEAAAVSWIDPAAVTTDDTNGLGEGAASPAGAICITGCNVYAANKLGQEYAFALAVALKRAVTVRRPDGSIVRSVDLGR
jgi:hypothetical protein